MSGLLILSFVQLIEARPDLLLGLIASVDAGGAGFASILFP